MPFNKLEVFQISSILDELSSGGNGSTKPIHIRATNDKEYVLKTRYNTNTVYKDCSIFSELLAYKLDKLLKFNLLPQKVILLYIDEYFLEKANEAQIDNIISQEALNNIQKSMGINLGIEYIDNLDRLEVENIPDKQVKDIIHLDNFTLNNDRDKKNPNILKSLEYSSKFYVIDFDNGFNTHLCYGDIIEGDFLSIAKAKNCNITLDSSYLFYENAINIKNGKKIEVSKDDIITIIDSSFPNEWSPLEYKNDIADLISSRIGNKTIFKRKNNGC